MFDRDEATYDAVPQAACPVSRVGTESDLPHHTLQAGAHLGRAAELLRGTQRPVQTRGRPTATYPLHAHLISLIDLGHTG